MKPSTSSLLLASLVAAGGCGSAPTPAANPTSLWLSYAQREVDLVLVDHEPPPF